MNNKLPEWRKTLNKSVENYQSTRAWYEENRDSPAALDDMERAEHQLANFVRKCGFSIVLSLLDEIDELQELHRSCLALRGEIEDVQEQLYKAENRNNADNEELQERRKADNQEPAGYHVIKECGRVGCSVATLKEAEKTRDFWNKKWTIRPYFYSAAPAPVVPDEISPKQASRSYGGEVHGYRDGWNACRAAMLQAGNSPVTPDGWISCSERMPEDEQEVIVQNKLGYRYVSYFDEQSGLFFDMRGGNQINCIEHILVTHWMPLPVPPQH